MGAVPHRLGETGGHRRLPGAGARRRPFAGPAPDAIRFLVEERDIIGFGTETVGTDAGQGAHLSPPYPAHYILHGAGRYGLQCLANLDLLPPKGALLICPPLKVLDGSGSPLRVLALVEG